jgi:hypothetical protein
MCLAAAASAQNWQVQSANWGAGNRRQDVTRTVRQLVDSGGNFTASNKTFGIDPAPGKSKTLTITARDQKGAVQTFTYNENETVNVNRFGGGDWYGGRPGRNRGLRILEAQWRVTDNRPGMMNVGSRLQGMVRNNRLDITANNQNMGGDPGKGKTKELYLIYQFEGRNNTITVREGNRVNIP